MKYWKNGGREGGLFSCLAAVLDRCYIPAILVTAERSISFYGKEEVTSNASQLRGLHWLGRGRASSRPLPIPIQLLYIYMSHLLARKSHVSEVAIL
jgi:hypothetical protein